MTITLRTKAVTELRGNFRTWRAFHGQDGGDDFMDVCLSSHSLSVNIKYVPLLICHHTSIKWLKNKRGILLYVIQITIIKLDSQVILSYKNKMRSN